MSLLFSRVCEEAAVLEATVHISISASFFTNVIMLMPLAPCDFLKLGYSHFVMFLVPTLFGRGCVWTLVYASRRLPKHEAATVCRLVSSRLITSQHDSLHRIHSPIIVIPPFLTQPTLLIHRSGPIIKHLLVGSCRLISRDRCITRRPCGLVRY
jgi:hypothetical protein